jgi:ATP-dependent DNA ligase
MLPKKPRGVPRVNDVLRRGRKEASAFLYAFDLLELNGSDLRREPIEVRKATLASILRKVRQGVVYTWTAAAAAADAIAIPIARAPQHAGR